MCRPLRDVRAINARLDAVQELLDRPELVVALRSSLQGELAQILKTFTQMTHSAFFSEAWGT
jgi:DNA mismatch repair ATPase MutS